MSSILNSVIEASVNSTVARTPEEGILERALKTKLAESQRVLDHVQNNYPTDRLLKAPSVWFAPGDGEARELVMTGGDGTFTQPLTRYALGQAAGKVGFPAAFAADVMAERGDVGRKVVADALTTLWKDSAATTKVMIRSVNGRIHGVLSDAFRRLDCRPGVDSFIGEVQRVGAVPYGGVVTDTRVVIKAVFPRIYKLHSGKWNDSIVLGAALSNSDFGAGTYKMNLFAERVRCLNGMILETLFAQRHLGGRIDESDFYSERTHKLDSATMVSATRDYVRKMLSAEAVDLTVKAMQSAVEKNLDIDAELKTVLKKAMTKEELKQVTAALQSVNEDEMPLGPPSYYRMANAISWVAGQVEDADRGLDLQRLAGKYLAPAA